MFCLEQEVACDYSPRLHFHWEGIHNDVFIIHLSPFTGPSISHLLDDKGQLLGTTSLRSLSVQSYSWYQTKMFIKRNLSNHLPNIPTHTHSLSLSLSISIHVYIYIYIYICLVGLVVSMSDYWSWGRGFDPRHFHNFKCGLGLERGPPSLVRTIGQLLDWEIADLIKNVDIIRLDRA